MKYNVSFEFLAHRKYVQLTSQAYKLLDVMIDNNMISGYNDIIKFDAVFREKIHKNGYFLFNIGRDHEEIISSAKSVFNLKLKDKVEKVYLLEDDREILESVPYDEDSLVHEALIDIDNLEISMFIGENTDKLLNILGAAIKQVHLRYFDGEGYSAWSTGKFNLNWADLHRDIKNNTFVFKLVSNIDDCYTKNDLFIKGKYYGSLYAARSRNS